jgi:hypothetical protein
MSIARMVAVAKALRRRLGSPLIGSEIGFMRVVPSVRQSTSRLVHRLRELRQSIVTLILQAGHGFIM